VLPAPVLSTLVLALFDLDNTLVDRRSAFSAWAREFTVQHQLGPDALDWLLQADDDGLLPRPDFFTAIRTRYAIPQTVQALHDGYAQRYPQFMHCSRTTLDGLAGLRATGWRLGVVTNGLTTVQTMVLHHTGLTGYLDAWSVSEAVGLRKPDPQIFRLTARRCGTDLTGGWMIGDSPSADIAGARSAGLSTIWIHRGQDWPGGPQPDHIAKDAPRCHRHPG
jgi:putative hydrolase of the HAD superfamily